MLTRNYSFQCKGRIDKHPVFPLISSESFKSLRNFPWYASYFRWRFDEINTFLQLLHIWFIQNSHRNPCLQDVLCWAKKQIVHRINQSKSDSIIVRELEKNRISGSTFRGKFLYITGCSSLAYFICSCSVVFVWSWLPAFTVKTWKVRFLTKWFPRKFLEAFTASWIKKEEKENWIYDSQWER